MKKTMNMNSCTILMEDRYSRNPFCKRVVRGGFVLEATGGGGGGGIPGYLKLIIIKHHLEVYL